MNETLELKANPPPALDDARADWPMFGLVDDIRPSLRAATGAGETSALVTLYAASGGAPRGVGAQMLVTLNGISGYLSGGCIEADVTHHALETIADGQPRWLVYGHGGPIDIRLPCGGHIELLVERIAPDDRAAARLLQLWEERRPALWFSDGSARRCIGEGEPLDPREDTAFSTAGVSSASRGNARTIYRRFVPQHRLVVVGSDPTSLALCTASAQSGTETFLVRPGGPETPPPIAGLRYLRSSPKDAFARIGLDAWTAVAIATHDDINDRDALLHALPSAAGYIGLLGSSRRLAQKLAEVRAGGVDEAAIARLKAPIGLPLGGRAPWQIATSILAEVIQWSTTAERSYVWRAETAA